VNDPIPVGADPLWQPEFDDTKPFIGVVGWGGSGIEAHLWFVKPPPFC